MSNEEKMIGISSLSPIVKKIKELQKAVVSKVSQLENDKDYVSLVVSEEQPTSAEIWEQPY